MALIKKHIKQEVQELPNFSNLEDAINYFESDASLEEKEYATEEIVKFDEGVEYLLAYISNEKADKHLSTKVASVISNMDSKKAPIEKIMDLLKLDNAYARNLGISMLRNFGDAIKYYIVKFLIGDDRDLRIFAINVLGDVNFSESRDMLIELLESEQDINVAMTAVDYLSEIGEVEDIELLKSLKERFSGEVYVEFAVESAIKSIEG